MKRRKFLLGVGSAAAAGSALIGSGAFSEVNAQRSVTVQVAEDPNAYLGMNDCLGRDGEPTANSSFADLDGNGHLRVDMGPSGSGGEGVNSDSISWFDNVFQICNQGKECVGLWIDEKDGDDPDRVTFYVDSGSPPARYVEDDLATRDRVQNDGDIKPIGNSEENAITLELGECVCVGIQTYTREDDSFEITSPSDGDQLLDEVVIAADVDAGDCGDVACPELTAQYKCTTYEQENPGDDYRRTGSRFTIVNSGDLGTTYDLAINDSPGDWRENLGPVGGSSSQDRVTDASVPIAGLVIWDPECREDVEGVTAVRWGDYKGGDNQFGETFDDLEDWYVSKGDDFAPGDAPTDLDNDTLVSEITNIPDTEEPDEEIPPDLYPDMSTAAEDAGWITCDKAEDGGS